MSSSTAELTLILKAQNLAGAAFEDVKAKLNGITPVGKQVARDLVSAFKGMGPLIAIQLAQAGADLLQGKDASGNFILIGVMFAGAVVEGLSATFLPKFIGWIASRTLVVKLVAAAATLGTTIGSALQAAIMVGMAALPYLIAAALIAAVTFAVKEAAKKAPIFTPQVGNPFIPGVPGSNIPPGGAPGHAAGGWVGLHGPELSWVGERGPEYINPAGPGVTQGFTIQGVSEREIIDMVDAGLYFRLRRAAPVTGRV